jgi:hypothetical protein
VSVRIQTPEQLAAELASAGALASAKAWSATKTAAGAIKSAQYNSAPVLTGETRRSISGTSSRRGGSVRADIGPTHFVARFLVFGTVKMSPKWDLFGASQAGMEGWLKDMADVVDL